MASPIARYNYICFILIRALFPHSLLSGMELDSYKAMLLRRFGNSAIGDQLSRLCLDGGSKIPGNTFISFPQLVILNF